MSYEGGLRAEFLRLLTTDSKSRDRRKRDYNQAVFEPDGPSIWSSTDLDMVMEKFDKAVKNLARTDWYP
jgi:hypothetical protein